MQHLPWVGRGGMSSERAQSLSARNEKYALGCLDTSSSCCVTRYIPLGTQLEVSPDDLGRWAIRHSSRYQVFLIQCCSSFFLFNREVLVYLVHPKFSSVGTQE